MAGKKTTLSVRGQQNAESGALMGRLFDVLGKPYDKTRNPDGIINLGTAENYVMHDELAKYINRNFKIDGKDCTYGEGATGSPRLRKSMAHHLNRYFKPYKSVESEEISFSAGVTAINEMYAISLADEGDGILLNRPLYGAFENDLTMKAKLNTIHVALHGTDAFDVGVVAKYEAALQKAEKEGTKVRAVLISNPHNPLGQCYSQETLRALLVFCQKHQLHLISDEIYALCVFDSGNPSALPFTSVLSIDFTDVIDPNLVHVLYGLSKDFGAGGLRLGCFITRNQELRQAMRSISMFHWPSNLSDSMAATILEDETFVEDYLSLSQQRLGESYRLATGILNEAGIAYHHGGNAGFFLWVDLSPYLPDVEKDNSPLQKERLLSDRILNAGVYLATGEEFHSEEPGWFRVVFSQEKEKLVEGLKRIVEVLMPESSQQMPA
ncbi:MAG: hypothetical protein M4579_002338 [Chaenotheca gracillima]|nr:MAG: hypothetical protein M4579_002338 [Chaenotheca gracillima]